MLAVAKNNFFLIAIDRFSAQRPVPGQVQSLLHLVAKQPWERRVRLQQRRF